MPKLPAKVAKRVDAAESTGGDYEPLPPGVYTVRLMEVDGSGSGPAGPYWSWVLEVQDEGFEGRKLWVNTSLSEKADWKMKEVFEAFGYSTDSDTDEMCGEECQAAVSQRKITQGNRAGQTGNNVDRLFPLGESGGDEGEDVFG